MDTARCPMFASFCDANMGIACTPSQAFVLFVCVSKKKQKPGPTFASVPPPRLSCKERTQTWGTGQPLQWPSLLGGESAKQKGLSFERPFIGRGGLSERQRRRTSPESFSSNYLACVPSAGAVVDAIWSRLFFSMLTSTRPPLMRTVLPSASVFGALPMPTTKIR